MPETMRVSLCLRDEEARPVQRILDHTWTKLAYDLYLPCTGQGFLAASGAVRVKPVRQQSAGGRRSQTVMPPSLRSGPGAKRLRRP